MKQDFLPNMSSELLKIPAMSTSNTTPGRETLRHLLIGSPQAVTNAIHTLHVLGYAEAGAWSPLQPIANTDEVMSILVRYLVLS